MKAKYIVIFFLSLLSFVACDKEEVVIPTTAPRTAGTAATAAPVTVVAAGMVAATAAITAATAVTAAASVAMAAAITGETFS